MKYKAKANVFKWRLARAFVVGTRDYSLDRVYAFFQALACPRVCLVLIPTWSMTPTPCTPVRYRAGDQEQQTFPHHFSRNFLSKTAHDHTPCVHSACPCAHCPGNGLPTATQVALLSLVEPGTPTIRFPSFPPLRCLTHHLPASCSVGGITSETSGPPYWYPLASGLLQHVSKVLPLVHWR